MSILAAHFCKFIYHQYYMQLHENKKLNNHSIINIWLLSPEVFLEDKKYLPTIL